LFIFLSYLFLNTLFSSNPGNFIKVEIKKERVLPNCFKSSLAIPLFLIARLILYFSMFILYPDFDSVF